MIDSNNNQLCTIMFWILDIEPIRYVYVFEEDFIIEMNLLWFLLNYGYCKVSWQSICKL